MLGDEKDQHLCIVHNNKGYLEERGQRYSRDAVGVVVAVRTTRRKTNLTKDTDAIFFFSFDLIAHLIIGNLYRPTHQLLSPSKELIRVADAS